MSERLAELVGNVGSDREIAAFIEAAGVAAGPTRRIQFLEALISLPSDHRLVRWHPEALLIALERLLQAWHGSGVVAQWAARLRSLSLRSKTCSLVAYTDSAAGTLFAALSRPLRQ